MFSYASWFQVIRDCVDTAREPVFEEIGWDVTFQSLIGLHLLAGSVFGATLLRI